MRLITCVAIAFMLFAVSAQGAEVPMSAGDKAMVFMFSGLDNLHVDGYGDYGFGMRYYISNGMALRGGVYLSMHNTKDESVTPTSERKYSMYGLEGVLEKHLEGPCPSVSPYLGFGGSVEMSSTEYTNWTDQYDNEYPDGKASTTVFGLFGVAGFEWGFSDCMSLGGEYRLGFESESGKFEPDQGESTDNPTDTWIGFDTASVYLSVYW